MLSRWPIRNKFRLGLAMLVVVVLALFGSACYGLYAYRGLVRSVSARSTELPLAGKVSRIVSDLRVTISEAQGRIRPQLPDYFTLRGAEPVDSLLLREEYRADFVSLQHAVSDYRDQLISNRKRAGAHIGDDRQERETLAEIERVVEQMKDRELGRDWILDGVQLEAIQADALRLQQLADQLPAHMHARLHTLAHEVRSQYRTAIVAAWASAGATLLLLILFVRMFRTWIARPLGTLITASQDVADGRFDRRIHLDSRDEMADLAEAMNAMTERFEQTRDDLDRQVHERTRQAVRSEQLASVGFLAAGVAHEINNPLASIAMCSESLETRLAELLPADEETAGDREVIASYLRMIQDESFRCKDITERLLDFSRIGDSQRHAVDLRELVAGVIEMVQHLGKYHDKHLVLADGPSVVVNVNPQELKQTVLNLITNGLDSLSPNGTVHLTVDRQAGEARIVVQDDGCGMTGEVIEHLFEPFFTRRTGGQGTGLGLAITYRIISEHNGTIVASSEGPGQGSQFTVRLPLSSSAKEVHHHQQAA